jgi:outer membrane protein TolC
MSEALQARPDITQERIRVENRDVNLKAIRNAMLPQLDLVADFTNNGLAGQINENFQTFPGQEPTPPSDYFIGGVGTALGQVFRRNFPDYQIRAELQIPLRNRRAQADMAATLLEKRQADIRLRQSENSIRAEVQNAVIGLQQARARYEAAQKSRYLQEETLQAEQKKFDLGASTIFLVVQAQRDLALARSAELTSMNNWVKARVEMDRAVGRTLQANSISIDEAFTGVVSKRPDPIPPKAPQGQN